MSTYTKPQPTSAERNLGRALRSWERACPGCDASGWTTNSPVCEWCNGSRVVKPADAWAISDAIHEMWVEMGGV